LISCSLRVGHTANVRFNGRYVVGRIKAQVITDGQNPPGPLRLHPTRPALQHRQRKRHAHALQKTAAVDRM
jgi:hypothetical protein